MTNKEHLEQLEKLRDYCIDKAERAEYQGDTSSYFKDYAISLVYALNKLSEAQGIAGEWIYKKYNPFSDYHYFDYFYTCSNCGCCRKEKTMYCPNCGSKNEDNND